jgi:hypothetical protein
MVLGCTNGGKKRKAFSKSRNGIKDGLSSVRSGGSDREITRIVLQSTKGFGKTTRNMVRENWSTHKKRKSITTKFIFA